MYLFMFLWSNSIPLCEYSRLYSTICRLMYVWVISIFWLLWINTAINIHVYVFVGIYINIYLGYKPRGITTATLCSGVWGALCLTAWGSPWKRHFPKWSHHFIPFYIPTSSVQGFWLIYIFTNTFFLSEKQYWGNVCVKL